MSINIDFHDVAEFFGALRDLYKLYTQKGHSYEDNLDTLIFHHYGFAKQVRNEKFNTTWVKKLNEKRMLAQDFKIKYIMPLVSIDGLIYLTDERIYM